MPMHKTHVYQAATLSAISLFVAGGIAVMVSAQTQGNAPPWTPETCTPLLEKSLQDRALFSEEERKQYGVCTHTCEDIAKRYSYLPDTDQWEHWSDMTIAEQKLALSCETHWDQDPSSYNSAHSRPAPLGDTATCTPVIQAYIEDKDALSKEEYRTLGACTAYCHELKKESSDDGQEENNEFTRLCQVLKNAHKTFPDTLSEKGEQRITQLLHPLSQEVLSLLNEKVQQAIAEEHSYSTLLQEVSQMIVERME